MPGAPATLVNTRPIGSGDAWTPMLEASGWRVLRLPLIEISPALEPHPIEAAWADLARWRALMFVSAAAVEHFFAFRAPGRFWSPDRIDARGPMRAWATGPGTAAALLAVGVPSGQIDQPATDSPQFDSEALWASVGSQVQAGDRVCIVRGGDAWGHPAGRDWLAQRLASHGVQVDALVAYRRRRPDWSDATVSQARAAAQAVWLFGSSQAVWHLAELCVGQDWTRATAIATHPRIGEAAQQAGFGRVICAKPGLEPLCGALSTLRPVH